MNGAAISIEPEDLDLTPFNQRGSFGKAHQLFGEQLPKLLDDPTRCSLHNDHENQ